MKKKRKPKPLKPLEPMSLVTFQATGSLRNRRKVDCTFRAFDINDARRRMNYRYNGRIATVESISLLEVWPPPDHFLSQKRRQLKRITKRWQAKKFLKYLKATFVGCGPKDNHSHIVDEITVLRRKRHISWSMFKFMLANA